MTTEHHRKRRAVKWVVLGAFVLVLALIALGISVTRDEPGSPDAGATSAQSESAQSDSVGGTASGEGGSGGSGDPSTASPTEEEPTDPPSDIGFDPEQTRSTEAPALAPAPSDGSGVELEPVVPEAIVEAPNGAVVSLVRIEAVQGQAAVGGEISGPAIRVSVAIRNDGTEPIDLEYVVVNAYSGSDRSPAAPIMQPGGSPFGGSLASGESADGVYLFSIGEGDRGDVAITVDYGAGEPIVVFRGDLG